VQELKHVIEGKIEARIEVTRNKAMAAAGWMTLKGSRKCCKLKEIALDRAVR
jgi:hypothetical protein